MADRVFVASARRDALVRDALLVLAGSLLVAVCAKIQAPGPVPFTMQTFAVCLVAAALGARRGAAALIAYLMEGWAGLPVFALPLAGPAYFAGDTTGYLIGFVFAAYVIGSLAARGWDRRFLPACAAFVLGHAIILLTGWLWLTLARPLGAADAFAIGVWPHLPSAVLKSALAALALPGAWRLLNAARFDPVAK
jgi:biotin transport system substrate-specific component